MIVSQETEATIDENKEDKNPATEPVCVVTRERGRRVDAHGECPKGQDGKAVYSARVDRPRGPRGFGATCPFGEEGTKDLARRVGPAS